MNRITPKSLSFWLIALTLMALLLSACNGAQPTREVAKAAEDSSSETAAKPEAPKAEAPKLEPTLTYTLVTGVADGKLALIGQGGDIDGVTNPELKATVGDLVQITLINGDGPEHDVAIPDLKVDSDAVVGVGKETTVIFTASKAGEFIYYCTVIGHKEAGMQGLLLVSEKGAAAEPATGSEETAAAVSVVRNPTDVPAPIGERGPETIHYDIEAVEVTGQLADGVTFTYWTFNGLVPGPFLRVRVGDTVEINLKNNLSSTMGHSIDLHAATGPGGGAAVTGVAPGEEKSFTFKALNPGLYVYHCATPMVAHHIANGMYGLILVEPEGGLPAVDREFYVMQGEIYTLGMFGERGAQTTSVEKLLDEDADYVVFNGAVGSLTAQYPMTANTGETVRYFFGVGGPNYTSAFHVIGEIFDRVFDQASLTAAPLTDVQTTLVPPGGATMVEFALEVPGRYILVDHALSRLERGGAGFLVVEGEPNPEVFFSENMPDGSH